MNGTGHHHKLDRLIVVIFVPLMQLGHWPVDGTGNLV